MLDFQFANIKASRVFINEKYQHDVVLNWSKRNKEYFLSSYDDFEYSPVYHCVQQICCNPEELFTIEKPGYMYIVKSLNFGIRRLERLRYIYVKVIHVEVTPHFGI